MSLHKLTNRSAVVTIHRAQRKSTHFLRNAYSDFENCDLLKETQADDELGQTLHRDHTSLLLTSRGSNYQLTV